MNATATAAAPGLFGWWRAGTPEGKRALVAASLGWMLDSFDVMLYALVLVSLMRDLSMDAPTAGLLGSITLLASAAGGLMFGVIADKFGRTRALMGSIIIYSIFTAACGLSQTASGPAERRWSPRLGRVSIVARRWDSCKARGPSATPPPRS